MAALTATTATGPGVAAPTPVQISAWSGPDTISAAEIGARGVVAIVANTSGGSLDFRVGDPGTTQAGNAAANGYTTVTLANNATKWVFIGPGNVNSSGVVQVGASSTNSAFVVSLLRF